AFKKWWNIRETTAGQALVVPINNNDTFLGIADFAWVEITKHLAAGKTVQFAVSKANEAINARIWVDSNNNPIPLSQVSNWQVIGDGNVRVAGKR
ncbi:MAG: hypothetical protein L0Z53_00010, partial [Acidobacteriales bacterium]|nr:hypothetical protein [Terriglobales bacterium]